LGAFIGSKTVRTKENSVLKSPSTTDWWYKHEGGYFEYWWDSKDNDEFETDMLAVSGILSDWRVAKNTE